MHPVDMTFEQFKKAAVIHKTPIPTAKRKLKQSTLFVKVGDIVVYNNNLNQIYDKDIPEILKDIWKYPNHYYQSGFSDIEIIHRKMAIKNK